MIKRTKASALGLPDSLIMPYRGGQIRFRAGTRWTLLQPKLGAFLDEETRIPHDYREVLALIAPRPLLLVARKYESEHNLTDARACVREVSEVYEVLEAGKNLHLYIRDDYNRYSREPQREVDTRLKRMAES